MNNINSNHKPIAVQENDAKEKVLALNSELGNN